MGWIARSPLASAVSNAGGLGIIETSSGELDNIRLEIEKMAALTDVKNQIGNMVIEIAEKVIRKQLDNKVEQEKYIQQMAGEIHQFGK
jgi:NAD(P)H-dependent flavin oxidoreductase YrpB (nitropropane dioxygenase family)